MGRSTLAAGGTGSQPDGRPLYRMSVATLSRPPRVDTRVGGGARLRMRARPYFISAELEPRLAKTLVPD